MRDPATTFPCFDGLRAVAAISVVLHHVSYPTGKMFKGYFAPFFTHLDIGVAVFFLISGFLLYRPFVAAAFEGRPGPSVRRFFRRRLLRIFPAYWLALIGIIIFFGPPLAGAGRAQLHRVLHAAADVRLDQTCDRRHQPSLDALRRAEFLRVPPAVRGVDAALHVWRGTVPTKGLAATVGR